MSPILLLIPLSMPLSLAILVDSPQLFPFAGGAYYVAADTTESIDRAMDTCLVRGGTLDDLITGNWSDGAINAVSFKLSVRQSVLLAILTTRETGWIFIGRYLFRRWT
ncbi:hypothetical protein F4677DRAFT_103541 [Hypoxylon crocopeplum]|nr:hypothetical protein F4677DRAFT_103541 [Hypoxylon crocopeplum]